MADSLLVDRIARQRGPSLAAWANGRIGSASARPPPLVGWCRRRFGRSARAGRSPLGKSVPPDRDERQRNGNRERSEEHTSELQSLAYLVCRLLLEKKKDTILQCAPPT